MKSSTEGVVRAISPESWAALNGADHLAKLLASHHLLVPMTQKGLALNVLHVMRSFVESFSNAERPLSLAETAWTDIDAACVEGLSFYFSMIGDLGTEEERLEEVQLLADLYWLIPDRNACVINGNLVVDSCMLSTKKKIFEQLLRYWVYTETGTPWTGPEAREVFKFLVDFFEQGDTSLGDKRQKTSRRNIECFERYWEKGDDRAIAGAYRVPHFDFAVVRDLLKAHISKFGRPDLDYWTSPSHLEMRQRLPVELARMLTHRSVDLMDGVQLAMVLKVSDLRVGAGFGAETG